MCTLLGVSLLILRNRLQGRKVSMTLDHQDIEPTLALDASRPTGRPRVTAPHSGHHPRRPLTAADVMTAAEVAELIGVPRSTVDDWARRKIVPSRKVGRRRIYLRSRIEALLLEDDTSDG
jgi:excisionase family DNA binding protein